jgi:hypothetical protein
MMVAAMVTCLQSSVVSVCYSWEHGTVNHASLTQISVPWSRKEMRQAGENGHKVVFQYL